MDKHYAQVLGVTLVKKYRVSFGEIVETYEKFETPVIWEGELDSPVLKSDDTLYLVNKGKEVKVTKVVRSTEGTYLYYTRHQVGEVLENELTEKSRLEAEEKLKSMKNDESEEKSESHYLNLDTEKVLDGHLIQLQMLNVYEKAYSPKELTHLLNSIANLNVISKWSEDYQSIIDEKLKDIQKFVLNKIGFHLKHNEFNLVDGWTELLIKLENKTI
ncbi:hypothetical protein [Lysinibacillus sp. BPa_S21]|uniref:hypothetical protein n=1 Tax=Lysinibacillus sp. BPa_S21 TaxID=2932478 RepID=UPI002012523C|nr:hypothetical protein [Lysinibacillus sp. BPa_S21]MCL1696412.1 hypothetical protein [Lysinibacillus sp. BPa_S21]